MKILFCGLGSIGARHLRNLSSLLREKNIEASFDALRSGVRALPDDIAPLVSAQYRSFAELPGGYDIAFVTNPTALHEQTVRALAGTASNLFIEKPVFAGPNVAVESLGLGGGVTYVACPLRHHPVYRRVAKLAEDRRIIAARAICSSYLPDWRPGTDYRACYSARRADGGGVTLDLIHEWDYLTALLGFPQAVAGYAGHCSALEIDSDDVAVYIARYPDKLLSLHLDYVGRTPRREIELYCEDGTVAGDFLAGTVTFPGPDGPHAQRFAPQDLHRNEMAYFLDCVLTGQTATINSVENALRVLDTATRCVQSTETK